MPVKYKIIGGISLMMIVVFMLAVISFCGLARRLGALRDMAPSGAARLAGRR